MSSGWRDIFEIFFNFAVNLAQGFCFDLGNSMNCCEEKENFVFWEKLLCICVRWKCKMTITVY